MYWNTIYTQRALDELPDELDHVELAGLTPTLFEHVNPLGTYDFNTDRPAGKLRPLREQPIQREPRVEPHEHDRV